MSCLVCHEERELLGLACAECLEELRPATAITPEQVRTRRKEPTTALVVDPWGRAHPLDRHTTIGRVPHDTGLAIVDATISRQHASLELRNGTWLLSDLGSANGTFIEGKRIEGETQLRDGERVQFGDVSFFFLDGPSAPPRVDTKSLGGFTVRGPIGSAAPPTALTIELREPTGGGGGVAVIGGAEVQLSLPQLELIGLLYNRAQSGDGFVSASELARTISLESAHPNEDHVRQLVRRLRRVLFNAGIAGLVESRYGAGYRLALHR